MPKRTRNHRSALLEDLKDNPQLAASYLSAALEESPRVFLRALRDVAETYRMAKVAEDAGLTREALYRTLSEEGNPRLSSLVGVISALNLKITIEVGQEQPVPIGTIAISYSQVSAEEAAGQESAKPVSLLGRLADQYSRSTQKENTGILAYAGH